MEALPVELTLDIAKNLSADACIKLIESSKQYLWLRDDIPLWKHLASRDFSFPEHLFERQLGNMNPAQLYQHLSRCQHLESIDGTIFVQRCGKPVFPGTPYCRDHCAGHSIFICPCCENDLVSVVDYKIEFQGAQQRFCPTCTQTEAWKKECQYVFQRGIHRDQQCGSKRPPGLERCRNCARRNYHAQPPNGILLTINPIPDDIDQYSLRGRVLIPQFRNHWNQLNHDRDHQA